MAIKEKILDGSLSPLADVSEDLLMEELQVSRTPIREAFQKLEKEGFVYIYPRKGTIVTDITLDLVHQLYETRFLNEPYICRRVCGRVSEKWLLEMRESFLKDVPSVSTNDEMKYYTDLDRELHSGIFQYEENVFLKQLINNVTDHSHRIRIKTSYEPENYLDAAKEHIKIIDAYLANDAALVEEVTRKHLDTSRKNALRYFIRG